MRRRAIDLRPGILLAILLLTFISLLGLSPAEAAEGVATVSPPLIVLNQPTDVTVTIPITDSRLIAGSVNLQRLDATGKVVAVLGTLADSGANGDAAAGDKIYTIRKGFTEASTTPVRLQVSWALKGVLKRAVSSIILVEMMNTEPDWYGLVDTGGGRVEVTDPENPLYQVAVTIPANQFASPTLITLSSSGLPNTMLDDLEPSGPCVEIGPNGAQFVNDVYITLPYNDKNDDNLVDGIYEPVATLRVITFGDSGEIQYVPIVGFDPAKKTVTIKSRHFSRYVPVSASTRVAFKSDMATSQGWEEASQNWNPASDPSATQNVCPFTSEEADLAHKYGVTGIPESEGNNILHITARKGCTDRVKVRSTQEFGDGIYYWRVMIPRMAPDDRGSVGAFLYSDGYNHHEIDFECGYGPQAYRWALRAKTDEAMCWLTNQKDTAFPYTFSGKYTSRTKVKMGVWRDFKIAIRKVRAGLSEITWTINGAETVPVYANYSDVKFRIYNSVESLETFDELGANYPPVADHHAYFDYVSFKPLTGPLDEAPNGFFEDFESANWAANWTQIGSGEVSILSNNTLNGTKALRTYDNAWGTLPIFVMRPFTVPTGATKVTVDLSLVVRAVTSAYSHGPHIWLVDAAGITDPNQMLNQAYAVFTTNQYNSGDFNQGYNYCNVNQSQIDTHFHPNIGTWYDMHIEANLSTEQILLWAKPSTASTYTAYGSYAKDPCSDGKIDRIILGAGLSTSTGADVEWDNVKVQVE
jgi:hypothetical protein